MVVFCCNACGESLKKNQVEKHYTTKCRQCEVLSCVDCGKEFWGNDYEKHIKCISEDEKYGGKDYKAKPGANKGEVKQEQWIQQVQDAISQSAGNPQLQGLLRSLRSYSNIPRKKVKFEKFLQNSLKFRDSTLISQAWDILSPSTPQNVTSSQTPNVTSTNGKQVRSVANGQAFPEDIANDKKDCEKIEKSKKKKKQHEDSNEKDEPGIKRRKQSEADVRETVQETGTSNRFDWEAAILETVEKYGEVSIKKIKKKVLSKYATSKGTDIELKTQDKLSAKFDKKLKKCKRIIVTDNNVKLKQEL